MNLKKMFSFLLSCILAFTLLISCNKAEQTSTNPSKKEGGTITFSAGSDPKVLNPMYGNDRVTMTINNALFSPLYFKEGEEIDYYLAESVKNSDDYLTYTLKLKKNLKWHDGKPLTPDDLIFTLDKVLDKTQNSHLRSKLIINDKPVTYKKVDDTTVEFKLSEVLVSFTADLASLRPIPKHIFEGEKDISKSAKNDKPIGSGPYKFKEFKKGESVTLVKNDDYFGGKPHIDNVVYRVIPDANTSESAFLSGEVSALYIKAFAVDKYKDKGQVVTFDEGMNNNLFFMMTNKQLAKKDIRKAIAYALDKEELLKVGEVSTEYASLGSSVFAPKVPQYTDKLEKYEYNSEKAKELIKSSGESNINLKLAYTIGVKAHETQSVIVKEKLKAVGIDVTLVPLERNAFIEKLFSPDTNKTFDMAFNGFVFGSEPSAYASLFEVGGGNNFTKYENKKAEELFKAASVEKDAKKRDSTYEEIQKLLADDLPLLTLNYPKSIVALDKKIGGYEEAQFAPIFMFRDLSKLYFTN